MHYRANSSTGSPSSWATATTGTSCISNSSITPSTSYVTSTGVSSATNFALNTCAISTLLLPFASDPT